MVQFIFGSVFNHRYIVIQQKTHFNIFLYLKFEFLFDTEASCDIMLLSGVYFLFTINKETILFI